MTAIPAQLFLAVFIWLVGFFLAVDSRLLLLSKSVRREISTYRLYRDVTLLPYNIPERTNFASFNFSVLDEKKHFTGINGCPPRNITIVLKPGSFPVLSPDGAVFPPFFWNDRVVHYSAEFYTDVTNYVFGIKYPFPGDWYAAVFLSYTDPNDDKILQQGLSSPCIAFVESSVSYSLVEKVTILSVDQPLKDKITEEDSPQYFRFYVPNSIWMVSINLTVESCNGNTCPSLTISAAPYRFPANSLSNSSLQVNCSSEQIVRGDDCVLHIIPSEEAWHYVIISSVPIKSSATNNSEVSYKIEVSFNKDNDEFVFIRSSTNNSESEISDCNHCWPRVPLVRKSYPKFFTFDYVRVPDENGKSLSAVNITTKSPTVFKFDVHSVKDIGGTLTFELRLDRDSKFDNITKYFHNVSIVSCLRYLTRSEPQFPDACLDNTGLISHSNVVVNSTTSTTGRVHVPYPEPGRWYLTLKPFCFVPANTTNGNDTSYSEIECSELNYTTVSFVLDSDSCGSDSCGRFGTCLNFMSGGLIFSTCVCDHGYRGWGCTDDSRVTPLIELLIAALLLTISNLLFIPAIFIAMKRRLWTESFVYFCTMFFSTFYHACEAGEDVYSFCIMRLSVLQFCDFYTAILALWVTVLAMADLIPPAKSLAHMVGAVGIALGTEYDRTSLAVFMVPTLVGLSILGFQWGTQCWRKRACYPKKRYWIFHFPVGVILVLVGIICYSFLQTRNNYKYVHSAWHALMAASIVFLLPMKKYTSIQSEESDFSSSSSSSRRPFWSLREFWCYTFCRRT